MTDKEVWTFKDGRVVPIDELTEQEAKEILKEIVKEDEETDAIIADAFSDLLKGAKDLPHGLKSVLEGMTGESLSGKRVTIVEFDTEEPSNIFQDVDNMFKKHGAKITKR